MVYGASDLEKINIVEREFVEKARHSSGIVVGGGPAVVRNNVVLGNNDVGIAREDYGRRGLPRNIVVTHNAIFGNDHGGILISSDGPVEAEISHNAFANREGAPLLVAGMVSGDIQFTRSNGSVTPDAPIFEEVNSAQFNVTPIFSLTCLPLGTRAARS